jgi:hypothetical protein
MGQKPVHCARKDLPRHPRKTEGNATVHHQKWQKTSSTAQKELKKAKRKGKRGLTPFCCQILRHLTDQMALRTLGHITTVHQPKWKKPHGLVSGGVLMCLGVIPMKKTPPLVRRTGFEAFTLIKLMGLGVRKILSSPP